MTSLCVPIFVESAEQARRDLALAAESGADLVELRLDTFHDLLLIEQLLRSATVPVIATARRAGEGGQCDLPDEERLELLRQVARLGASYVDLELQTASSLPGSLESIGSSTIVSAHDFQTRPHRLYSLLEEMTASTGTINKVAWSARTVRDNVEAFELLLQRTKPTIAVCMGEAGLISRVLAGKFGAFLTFAALRASAATAPGQPTVRDLLELYRFRSVTPSTRVYGVVGSPIAHSMSPAIHNAAFESVGFDGVYVPLLVNPGYESFKAFAESFVHFDPLSLGGLSVTIPHKENALRWLREKDATIDPLAERIGAVNTIVIERASTGRVESLRGFSSDYDAILDTIVVSLGIDRAALAGRRVAVLGAGGTGRTAVAALAALGATVVVYNRTFDRARQLADEFDGTPGKVVAARWEKLCDSCCQILVNTTPIGMSPHPDASPIEGVEPATLDGVSLVFDTIYNPPVTKLLAAAKARGTRTASGVDMFVRQAAAQFNAWTQHPAPLDVMRAVVESRLR